MILNKEYINTCMAAKGIKTQADLAKRMGITKSQMSVILSPQFNPIKSNVIKLANILEVSPVDLLNTDKREFIKTETSKTTSYVKGIELFAGAGGLALGLEEAGITTIAHIEFDKACCNTLRKNRPEWNVIEKDIHEISFSQYLGEVDIVTGGPPCQAFSYAGKKLGFEDTRGTLFHEFARCVKETNPKLFLMENVRGLLSHDHGRTFTTIIDVLSSIGYRISYKVLNAAYYGVGQKRERIVIIGIRNDIKGEFIFPEPDKTMTTLRDALYNCPQSPGIEYSEKKRKVFELVPPGGSWVDLPEDIAKEYMGKSYYSGGGRRGMARRIAWDEPCLTLTCSPSQKQTDRCHPDETRPFTIREYARIQSFPDDWEFTGTISDQYKQIGNAVPVELAHRIGKSIIDFFSNQTENN